MKKVTSIIISLGLSIVAFGNHPMSETDSPLVSGITITPASNMVIDCTQDYFDDLEAWLDNFGGAKIVTNDCEVDDETTWDYGPTDYEAGCGGAETYTVTFIASNSCGDAIGTTASFIIEDNQGPTIHAPSANTLYSCTNRIPVAWTSDSCGEVDFTETIDPYVEDYCNGFSVTYHWTAVDPCGNTTTLSRTYTVSGDNTPPVISPRSNSPLRNIHNGDVMRVSCMDNIDNWDPNAFSVSDVTVNDNCSEVEILLERNQMNVGDCSSAGYLSKWRHTWTATDACGNSSVFEFFTEVIDNRGPTFSYVPADMVTDCHNIPPPEQAWAFDACSSVNITFRQDIEAGSCGGESVIVRKWIATDGCGNQTTAQQRIQIIDNTPPRIYIQDPALVGLVSGDVVELECESWNELYYGADAIFANDDCTQRPDVQYDLQLEHFPTCNEDGFFARATSTWIVSDECGNSQELVLYFMVGDHTPPKLLNVPAAICAPILPPTAHVTATDNCSEVEIAFEETAPQQGDDGTIFVERRWTAFDECGNADWGVQRITIEDRISPEVNIVYPGLEDIPIGGEAFVPFDCNGDSLGVPTFTRNDFEVTDNVGVQEVTWETTLIISGDCPRDSYLHKVVLSVTAIDKCGNFTRYSILLTIVDQMAPEFNSFPPKLTLTCGTPVPMVEAIDDCGGPVDLSFEDTSLTEGSCTGQEPALIRVWTAVDQCGNTSTATQTIHLIDDMGPAFIDFPRDTCGLPAPAPLSLLAVDACLNEMIPATLTQDTLQGDCGIIIRRTYSATDRCGNTTSRVHTIIETDNTPPVMAFVHPRLDQLISGQTITQNCVDFQGEAYPDFDADAVEVLDNCSDNIEVQLVIKLVETGNCTLDGYLERYQYTWRASDPCGNTSELVVFINATDISPPIFAYSPRDTTIFCESEIPSASDIVIADGCSEYDVDFTETFHTISPTIQQIRRKWIATDACGNSAETKQSINIVSVDLEGVFTTQGPIDCNSINNNLGIQVSGGEAPYSYHWGVIDGEATITAGQSTANILYSAGAGPINFVVKIIDANQCLVMEYIHIACEMEDGVLPPSSDALESAAKNTLTNFILLPNPTNQDAFVEIDPTEGQRATLSVQNIFGKIVHQESWEIIPSHPIPLPTHQLINGIYTVSLQIDDRPIKAKQLVIMR